MRTMTLALAMSCETHPAVVAVVQCVYDVQMVVVVLLGGSNMLYLEDFIEASEGLLADVPRGLQRIRELDASVQGG
jgi:hypothetical protein